MLDEVLVVPELEYYLILGICQDRIRPWTTSKCIATCSPGELVIAVTALQHVVPGVAPQGIVPSVAQQRVIAEPTDELVCTVAACEVVIAVIALQEIIAGVAR